MMDNIFVSGATMPEHDESLCPVLETLVVTGVTLNLVKCAFAVREVSFSGYAVDATGIRVEPKEVDVTELMPTPVNVPNMRSFLGRFHYSARFVPNLAEVSAPLRELLHE